MLFGDPPFDGIRVDLKDLRLAARAGGDGEADQAAPGRAGVGQRRQAAARAARRERERDHDHLSRVPAAARRDAADRQRGARRGGGAPAPGSTRRRSCRVVRHVRGEATLKATDATATCSPAICAAWSSSWRISISISAGAAAHESCHFAVPIVRSVSVSPHLIEECSNMKRWLALAASAPARRVRLQQHSDARRAGGVGAESDRSSAAAPRRSDSAIS